MVNIDEFRYKPFFKCLVELWTHRFPGFLSASISLLIIHLFRDSDLLGSILITPTFPEMYPSPVVFLFTGIQTFQLCPGNSLDFSSIFRPITFLSLIVLNWVFSLFWLVWLSVCQFWLFPQRRASLFLQAFVLSILASISLTSALIVIFPFPLFEIGQIATVSEVNYLPQTSLACVLC